MKTYTSQPNEDLGIIAKKFGMPSWKYLYELNKEKIGDNPDLLQSGIELDIPEWDTTSGDEKIEAKGVSPFAYTGGVSYRYPWVPVSLSVVDINKKLMSDFEEERKYVIWDRENGKVFSRGDMKKTDVIESLAPDSNNLSIGIKGVPIVWENDIHYHPDDIPVSDKKKIEKENKKSSSFMDESQDIPE